MGFHYTHYVPILKGRAGEFGALQAMTTEVKAALTPVIEVPPTPWDFEGEQPAKTTDQHLETLSTKISQSWGLQRPAFLDLLWIAPGERMVSGEHPLTYVFRTARRNGLRLIPVTGLVRDEAYQSSCRDIVAQDGGGVCVRLQREDFEESGDLTDQVAGLLDTIGVSPGEADLILDLRAVSANEGNTLLAAVPVLVRSIPQLAR
jgi:hypothetical protein